MKIIEAVKQGWKLRAKRNRYGKEQAAPPFAIPYLLRKMERCPEQDKKQKIAQKTAGAPKSGCLCDKRATQGDSLRQEQSMINEQCGRIRDSVEFLNGGIKYRIPSFLQQGLHGNMIQRRINAIIRECVSGKKKRKKNKPPELGQVFPMDQQGENAGDKKSEPQRERGTCFAKQKQSALKDERQHRHEQQEQPCRYQMAFYEGVSERLALVCDCLRPDFLNQGMETGFEENGMNIFLFINAEGRPCQFFFRLDSAHFRFLPDDKDG